jgi:GT2 family glycosyltransferase
MKNMFNKYDIIVFPKNFFNNDYQKDNFLPSYFKAKGHRVFYFNINPSNSFKVRNITKYFKMIDVSYGSSRTINAQSDKIVVENSIKECVIYVENPRWQPFIAYLKEKYNFKVIFNCCINCEDSIMFNLSDIVITSNMELYETTLKNDTRITAVEQFTIPSYIEKTVKDLYSLVSIVIVTYNNLKYTKQCLDSIITKTAYPNYEIIIVDNCSQDETPVFLRGLEKEHYHISIFLNNKNYGFAKANNIGIKHSKGNYIILLNNDTIVTRGWIGGLVKHLERDEKLGIVGPVTNNCGNEAKIDIEYYNFEQLDVVADKYTFANINNLYKNINMVALFCAAFRRELVDQIGYLDESFGIGMFEDDDFCFRIRRQGYKIACAEDVFIHHHGSISFNKIASKEYQQIFNRNKKIYEKKWNISWTPHKYRSSSQSIAINNRPKDIMLFSIIDWSFRYQRPQHIASYFAKENYRVFYFNASFFPQGKTSSEAKNLDIISLDNKLGNLLYFTDFNLDLSQITEPLDKMIRTYGIRDCIMISEYPNWHPITDYLKKKYKFKLVVDYLDEFTAFSTTNSILLKYSNDFMKNSDLVIASSNYLYEKAREKDLNAVLIRNGTEFSHFNKALKEPKIDRGKRPVIGYYGALAEWFDNEKVYYIASLEPGWDIVLIGDISSPKLDKLNSLPNVNLLGEKNYIELPNYLKDFDVCIIPFLDSELIKAANPVKFYEYLSAGKKIVATEIPELLPYKEVFVYLTNDNEEFREYIRKCINNNDTLAPIEEKLKFAVTQDWSVRCKEIEDKLREFL